MQLFQPADPPEEQKALKINPHGEWYTWSEMFRKFVVSWQMELEGLGDPQLIDISSNAQFRWINCRRTYSQTFSLGLSTEHQSRLIKHFIGFVEDLMRLNISDRIMFLTDLIDETISGNMLRTIFACFRDTHTLLSKDNTSALYAPLGKIGKRAGEFFLHADLYGPDMLFNVYEEVPDDETGASTFLSASELQTILLELAAIPATARQNIMKCLTSKRNTDGFHDLFDLLHSPYNEWTFDLGIAMKNRQSKIKMKTGQGYIINDRKWLHGREKPTGGVSSKRLHRLVFRSNQRS